jgi:hypothetical protein
MISVSCVVAESRVAMWRLNPGRMWLPIQLWSIIEQIDWWCVLCNWSEVSDSGIYVKAECENNVFVMKQAAVRKERFL